MTSARPSWLPPARFRAAVAAVLLAVAPVALVTAPAAPATAADDVLVLDGPEGTGFRVEVTPGDLSGVAAGDLVRIRVSGMGNGDTLSIGTCAADIPAERLRPFDVVVPGCSARYVTGLAGGTDAAVGPGLSTLSNRQYARQDGTLDVSFLVGRGTAQSKNVYFLPDNERQEVQPTCTEDSPCAIGFSITNFARSLEQQWVDVTSLPIAPADPSTDTTGCEGLGDDTVTGFGPERSQDLLSRLNRGACQADPGPLPVAFVPSGETENLPNVGGSADLAVVGSPALATADLPDGSLLVPLALQAVTAAHWGGRQAPSVTPGQVAGSADPVPALALTAEDVADVVLHDYNPSGQIPSPRDAPDGNGLAVRLRANPENADALRGFDRSLFGLPLNVAPTVTYGLGTDSTAIALSDWLDRQASSAWTFPTNEQNDALERSGDPVGAVTAFDALRDEGVGDTGPQLTSQVSSVGGLFSALFGKDLPGQNEGLYTNKCPMLSLPTSQLDAALSAGCLRYAVVDTGTAAALALTPSRLAAGDGYVAPDAASVAAAAATPLTEAGYFAGGAEAYPLAFVEYAVVPGAGLRDETCAVRAGAQQQLVSFLEYTTDEGQGSLPAGFFPLTGALKEQAAQAISKIGSGVPTGACAPKPSVTPTPTATQGGGSGGAGGSGGSGAGGSGGGSGSSGGGSGTGGFGTSTGTGTGLGGGTTTPVSAPTGAPVAAPSLAPASQAVPLSPGRAGTSPVPAVLGLLLVLGIAGGAAVVASGRRGGTASSAASSTAPVTGSTGLARRGGA